MKSDLQESKEFLYINQLSELNVLSTQLIGRVS